MDFGGRNKDCKAQKKMERWKQRRRVSLMYSLLLNNEFTKKNKLKDELENIQHQKTNHPQKFWFYFDKLQILQGNLFYSYFNVTPKDFGDLLSLLKPYMEKHRKCLEEIVPISAQLALTLRYLITGESVLLIAEMFKLKKVGGVILQTCDALWELLNENFFEPTTQNWLKVSKQFKSTWHFPNCIGALRAQHVKFNNEEGVISQENLIITSVVSADYKFLMVDIGTSNELCDDEVFENTVLGKMFLENEMNVPAPRFTSETFQEPLPYVLVADESFDMKEFLMCPFKSNDELMFDEHFFNLRMEEARRTTDNAFGIMASRWGIFENLSSLSSDKVVRIVKATICLHNWFMSKPMYFHKEYADYVNENSELMEGSWRKQLDLSKVFSDLRRVNRSAVNEVSVETRNLFVRYFKNENVVICI